jgi:hypothetical protein
MLGSGRFNRRILGLGGTLVLFAAVCACPATARAECGDYVIVIRNTDGANPAPDHAPMPAGPKCQGFACSGAPSTAAPLPAPNQFERPGLELAAIARQTVPAPRGVTQPVSNVRFDPSNYPSDIFHPPRTV